MKYAWLVLVLAGCAWAQGAGKEIGSGAGDIGKGAAKGAGNLAKGAGKGALNLVRCILSTRPVRLAGAPERRVRTLPWAP